MDKVKEQLARFEEAVKDATDFLDVIDENATNYDALIEGCLQHRKNLNKVWQWDCRKYLHKTYFKPLNDSFIKPILKKYPIFSRYDKYRIEYEHAVPEFLERILEGDGSYIWKFEREKEKYIDSALKDVKEAQKKYEEVKHQYAEARKKVDEAQKYFLKNIDVLVGNIFERIVNTIALLKAKKNLSK